MPLAEPASELDASEAPGYCMAGGRLASRLAGQPAPAGGALGGDPIQQRVGGGGGGGMDFTAIARQAIYSTLSPDAVLSPSSSLHGPASLSPLHYPGGVLSPSDGTSYAELVAAARAAVASLPTRTLPPRLSPLNAGAQPRAAAVAATLTELDLSLQRLESLRGAAASLEAQRRVSPTGARLDAAMLQGARGSPQRLAASDLRASSAGPGAGAGSAAAMSELRSSLTATAERLQAATASLGAASASGASAAASPVAAHSRWPASALTPAWTQATPQAAAAATPPPTSSAAASPVGGAGAAAAAAARDRFSPIATPSRKRPLPVPPIASAAAAAPPPPPPPPLPPYPSCLEDAHAAQRSAEALYLVSSSWRAAHHTPEALAHPAQGSRLVTYALEEGEGEGEEGQGRLGGSGRGGAFSASSSALPPSPRQQPELFLASLCHAAGLEWHQQDQLLTRVKALSRASVACAGLNAFAGRVCHQLGTRLVGLGEAWQAREGAAATASVHYRPLRAMAQAAAPPAQPWGPAYTGLSQAEALLEAALNELNALRVLRAHQAAGGRA